jgi:Uma2 family endonuclease
MSALNSSKGRFIRCRLPQPACIRESPWNLVYKSEPTLKRRSVFVAPFDVRLPKSRKKGNEFIDTVVQPDICVICDPSKIDEAGCLGAPDWIIEILSPHTSAKDLSKKFDLYEKSKVKEYWVVHPVEATILVFTLNTKGKYISRAKPYIRTDKLASATIPGLVIDLEEVFPEAV